MEYADFNGFVMTKPCPVCNSELVYSYTQDDSHYVECSSISCKFTDKSLEDDFLEKRYGGLAPKQQCGKELLDLETIASIDRLALDVQQLQDMFEKHKCCMNCHYRVNVEPLCKPEHNPERRLPVCRGWKSYTEEIPCAG
jgi:ssDNA-binding Zn-finger/Zn-ribbon topoisomerase 1